MTFELTPDEDRSPEELAAMAKARADWERADTIRTGKIGCAVIAIGLFGALFVLGSWLFGTKGPSGDGSLYGGVMAVVAVGFFSGLIGTGIRLPFFGNMRRVGLAVCLVSLVGGVPLAKAVRTPEQVAEDERIDQVIAAADAREESQNASDKGYTDVMVISGAEQSVKRKLVDDRSARFRNVRVIVQSSGTKAVCGEVNSKNRAGGYSGYQHFISAGTDEYTYLEEQVSDFSSAWSQICVR